MDLPVPDPRKLLAQWQEWETGAETPGRVMANLKTGGMPQLLEALVANLEPASGDSEPAADSPAAEPAAIGGD